MTSFASSSSPNSAFPPPLPLAHSSHLHDLKFDFYGRRLATVAGDQTVKVWDYVECDEEGQEKPGWKLRDGSVWQGHKGSVLRVCWAHPEFGQLLATCGSDHTAQIWEEQESSTSLSSTTTNWHQKASLTEAHKSVTTISFAPRHVGLKIATGSADGIVRIYEAIDVMNLNHWPLSHNFTGDSEGELGVTALDWCTGRFEPPMIVVGGSSGSVKIWRFDEGSRLWGVVHDLTNHGRSVYDIRWAPNVGRSFHLIASSGKDGKTLLHRLNRIRSNSSNNDENNSGGNTNNNDGGDLHQLAIGTTTTLENPNGNHVCRLDWNVTGTVLAAAGDGGTVTLFKADFNGRFRCVSEVAS